MQEDAPIPDPRAFFATLEAGPGPLVDLPEGVALTFVLTGEGGGTWTVRRLEHGVEVIQADSARPDCRLNCSVTDFQALLAGTLDSRQGFMEGRLAVEGDVGLILRLERVLLRGARGEGS